MALIVNYMPMEINRMKKIAAEDLHPKLPSVMEVV